MKIKVKDIAQAAGVSTTAVSLVLNDRPNRLSDATREKIKRIAAELAFQSTCGGTLPHAAATRTIGFVLPDTHDPCCAELGAHLQAYAFSRGCVVLSCMTGESVAHSRAAVEALAVKGVEGLIYVPPMALEKEDRLIKTMKLLQDQGLPIVLLDCAVYSLFCDFVSSDNKYAGRLAVETLLRQGHQRIGCIAGSPALYTARTRLQGYRDGLSRSRLSLDESLIQTGVQSESDGFAAASALYSAGCRAVFAASSDAAYGALRFAREQSLRIPEDFALIGYDMLPECGIPCIRQDMRHMAEQAVDLMLERLEPSDETIPPRNFYLPPALTEAADP